MNTETAVNPALLPVVQRVKLALNSERLEAEFRALAAESAEIVAITNEAGYQQAHAARMRLVKARTTTAKNRLLAADDAASYTKGLIVEEKRLLALIAPEEARLQALQGAEDAKREAKIKSEIERAEQIQAHIRGYAEGALAMAGKPAAEIAGALEAMRKIFVGEWAMEFKAQAQEARDKAIAALEQLHAGAVAQETAKVRAEQEVEARKIEADRRAVEDAARKQREATEERERAARAEQAERKAQRKRNEILDGRAMLETFFARFHMVPEFGEVASAIGIYLTNTQTTSKAKRVAAQKVPA